jgi:hypothetical protein
MARRKVENNRLPFFSGNWFAFHDVRPLGMARVFLIREWPLDYRSVEKILASLWST